MSVTSNVLAAEFAGAASVWTVPPLPADNTAHAAPGAMHTAKHLDDLETAAHEEGFAQGHAEGYAAGARAAREQAAHLQNLLDHFAQPLKDLEHDVERALVTLCVGAAQRLACSALQQQPELVEKVVREAVAALAAPSRELTVRLHPDDVELVRAMLVMPQDTGWRLTADKALHRGECRVASDASRVDARMETRAQSLLKHMLGDDE